MAAVVIFDADNTVWETDSVFRSAQLAMLTTLGEAGYIPDSQSQIEMLRVLDRELIEQLGVAEYDFRLLADAVTHFYTHQLSVKEAVGRTLDPAIIYDAAMYRLIDVAHDAFETELAQAPPLFSDTEFVLSEIRRAIDRGFALATVLYSEGNEERLKRILDVHQIPARGFFDEVLLAPKSTEGFERAKTIGRTHLPKFDSIGTDAIVIGDSLKRDIAPANLAHCITVYKPSAFRGVEVPQDPAEQPKFTVSSLSEFLNVLVELGYAFRPPV